MNTFPASLESLQRRDAAEAALCMVVIEVVCAVIAFVAWGLLQRQRTSPRRCGDAVRDLHGQGHGRSIVTFAQLLASIARHARYLWAHERAAFAPCASELAVQQIAARMGVRLPGVAS